MKGGPTAVRRLDAGGIRMFREFLAVLRQGTAIAHPPALLYDDARTERVGNDVVVEPRSFASKLDAARYLRDALRPIDRKGLSDDKGLWSWLTLYYINQLAPAAADGTRRPRQDYFYVPGGSSAEHYRHLLAGPYKLLQAHGELSRALLHSKVHQHGAILYALSWHADLVRNRAVVEALDRLYVNQQSGRPKRGASTESRPGNVRRFVALLRQLEVNYDLYALGTGEILGLLPREFDPWRG